MNLNSKILHRLAVTTTLAAMVAACSSSGDGNTSSTGGSSASVCSSVNTSTTTGSAQGAVCGITNGVTGLSPVNTVLDQLLNGSSLSSLITQINGLTGPQLADLINKLTLANQNGVLTPLISGLNTVLSALLNSNNNPAAVATALQGLLGGAGTGSSPLLGALSSLGSLGSTTGGANAITSLLAGLAPTGASSGSGSGLVNSVQSIVSNLTTNTPLSQVNTLVNYLVNTNSGALSPVTAPLNTLTATQLSALTQLVNQLAVGPNTPAGAVVASLQSILSNLNTGSGSTGTIQPTAVGTTLSSALGGLLNGLASGGAASPTSSLTSVISSSSSSNPLGVLTTTLNSVLAGLGL